MSGFGVWGDECREHYRMGYLRERGGQRRQASPFDEPEMDGWDREIGRCRGSLTWIVARIAELAGGGLNAWVGRPN